MRENLPSPSERYDVSREREFRARLQSILGDKVNYDQDAAYGGIPIAINNGTNDSFSATNGVETLIPVNTVKITSDAFVQGSNIRPVYPGWVEISWNFLNNTAAAAASIGFTINVYEGAAKVVAVVERVDMSDLFTINGSIIINAAATGDLTFKASHTRGSPIILDLTKSYVCVKLLQKKTSLREITRL